MERRQRNAHKDLKGLKTQNLRDHMTEAELIFTALAELSTRQIAETIAATGMAENQTAAQTGGKIARRARSAAPKKSVGRTLNETTAELAQRFTPCLRENNRRARFTP